jgi:SAM-dependent methyltransferase
MSDDAYTGVDNLEVLTDAERYTRFLTDLVVEASGGCVTAVDFGAGSGSLSLEIRRRGLDVKCIEPDPHLREMLRRQDFETYPDLQPIPDESQEFIYSLNVLEHIDDDAAALEALFSKLKPGGRLFLYVPAFGVLFSSMDRKIGHYRRYRKNRFRRIARQVGLSIERMEYADSLGFFATLLYKIFGSRRGDLSPSSVRFYDRVFPVSRLLDRLGCSRVLGKNLIVLMRR